MWFRLLVILATILPIYINEKKGKNGIFKK